MKVPKAELPFIEKNIPQPTSSLTEKDWAFSFKYFNQIDLFGFSHTKRSWFSSLLERLKELSSIDIEKLSSDTNLKQALRYHEIDWMANKIPISRSDLSWIHPEILKNEEEFPLLQFLYQRH